MRCPKCSNMGDKVVDSRSVREGGAIRRRRKCLKCGYRFTTYEEIVKNKLRVAKRDGRHEEFSKDKLFSGIERACEKRQISVAELETLTDNIITELEAIHDREVPSMEIGKLVMKHLEQLDEVAYVRFASVYRRFRDVNQFLSEVETLIGR